MQRQFWLVKMSLIEDEYLTTNLTLLQVLNDSHCTFTGHIISMGQKSMVT